MKHSAVTNRRLKDGATALEIPVDPLPTTVGELEVLRGQLHDGIAALQSLDDLGSEDANRDAYDDMLALQYRYDRVVRKIEGLSNP